MLDGANLPAGLRGRVDGVFFDAAMPAPLFLAAVQQVFQSGGYFAGLDYSTFLKALYGIGPDLRPALRGEALVRLAAGVQAFPPARRALYKLIKINDDSAEYYFEPMFVDTMSDAGGVPARPAPLDFDEFVADLWSKGVRFGIDVRAVRAIIASGKTERIVVARRLAPVPGRDAQIVEVAADMHRDDAPRERADGRLDLLNFKNRFPQVKKHRRLLKKMPAVPGKDGIAMSGAVLPAAAPLDADLAVLAGEGTVLEVQREGEFLVALQDGFVNVDHATGQISIDSRIVSHEGVSSRTTGNLKLRAAYEEFGEVQEQRMVDGSDITIHGNVFGHLHSHGGEILLHGNLVGGTALNNHGNVRVEGVASGSVVQTAEGEVHMQRAENCVVSGTRVVIEHASNCDIIADQVLIELAEGCAIAGRSIELGSAGPRKQAEMLVFTLVPDMAVLNRQIADSENRAADFGKAQSKRQQEIEQIGNQAEVRNYLTLAGQLRRQELALLPNQMAPFQKLASAVAPALKEVARLRLEVKHLEIQQVQMLEKAAQAVLQKKAVAGQSHCRIRLIDGEVLVRTMHAESDRVYDKTPRDIKARLRGVASGVDLIFAGSTGTLDWTYRLPDE